MTDTSLRESCRLHWSVIARKAVAHLSTPRSTRPNRSLYPGYSSDFHDGKHLIICGASYATPNRLARPSFQNWCVFVFSGIVHALSKRKGSTDRSCAM